MSRPRRPKVVSWTDDLYHATFHAVLGTAPQAKREFRRLLPKGVPPEFFAELDKDIDETSGLCSAAHIGGTFTVCIWIDPAASIAPRDIIAAHEALHATEQVLGRAGLTMRPETVEAFTYYQGWVLSRLRGLL